MENVTPLMMAAIEGKVSEVKRLLKEGVDINAINEDGQTALIYAVAGDVPEAKKGEILSLLLNTDPHPLAITKALTYCRLFVKESKKLQKLLKEHGAQTEKLPTQKLHDLE